MRLFVALQIPSEVGKTLAALLAELCAISREPRWVRPENLHVTLKFLGEVTDTKFDSLRVALTQVRSPQPVTVEFRGLGFFPTEKHPRVFWAGMEASPNLRTLAEEIENAVEKYGIPREKREFSPHLTLARLERRKLDGKLGQAIAENAQRSFGTLWTKEFHLVQSKLKPSGAEYTTLASFSFAPSEA